MDADRALVILMARSFAQGDWSLYFWEQDYMASLEAALLAPLEWVGALTGLAYFGDHLMLVWALAVGWVAARRGGPAALAFGAVPLVAFDTVAAVLTPSRPARVQPERSGHEGQRTLARCEVVRHRHGEHLGGVIVFGQPGEFLGNPGRIPHHDPPALLGSARAELRGGLLR